MLFKVGECGCAPQVEQDEEKAVENSHEMCHSMVPMTTVLPQWENGITWYYELGGEMSVIETDERSRVVLTGHPS
ncbi:MAG: hypothetical protein WBD82_05560, partial [Acidimicrobiales bacterium]